MGELMGRVFSRISTIRMRCSRQGESGVSIRPSVLPIIHRDSFHYSPMVKTDAISEMQFFTLLAKKGSLSAAARELDITPPAVTKRLAQMEQRLGVMSSSRAAADRL